MTTKVWQYVEVSCWCGLAIEFYHWMDPPGFTLEHDYDSSGSGYVGGHILRHSDTEGRTVPFQTYLSYIEQMIVVKEATHA